MLDIETVAKQLSISVITVRRLIRDGRLRAYKVAGRLRFKQSDIDAYLEANVVKPQDLDDEEEQ